MPEKTIQTKQCKNCSTNFDITDKDIEFYDKVSPVFEGKKYNIPAPTLCPDCRQQRRLTWRNERKFYKRKCDLTGKNIISIYSPDSIYKVYKHSVWYTDKWDVMKYGKDYDFTKNFFEQFETIHQIVPKPSLFIFSNENCDYTNLNSYNKNCYLIIGASSNESCYYSTYIQRNNNIIDCLFVFDSENCYNCVDCYSSYKIFYSQYSKDCKESYFLYNCINCENCFGCVNLINKKYYIFNQQYSKEDYFLRINDILKNNSFVSYSTNKLLKLQKQNVHKSYAGNQNESISGNHISFSKNTYNSYDVTYLDDCKYNTWLHKSKDCYDCYAWGLGGELGYENHLCGNKFKSLQFCESCDDNISNVLYSRNCKASNNLFGCVGLRNKQYCILNKQYTKEQYEQLVPKIIQYMQSTNEWGEFFPASISPFGYNETVAHEYFPLNKEQALNKGYKWMDKEYPINVPDGIETINAQYLPDNITDVQDDILKKAVICEITGKPFRIVKPELEFYRKHNIPLPRKHPDQRHLERMKLRNPRKLFDRKCDKCSIDMKTTYAPEREEIIYCEKCYDKEIYG